MVIIKNDFLQAAIEEKGAQLCSLVDLEHNQELIWTGAAPFWKYHAPVLFPFVGAVIDNQYRYRGKTYNIGQHGFARQTDFSLVSQTEDAAVYELKADEQTKEIYPFDFCFTVSQRLVGHTLQIEWNVKNPSADQPLYFSIGAHPAFCTPPDDRQRKNECYVLFPGKESLTYILKAENGADTEHSYEMKLDNGYLKLEDHLFDIDTFIFENTQIEEVSLCGADRKPYVTLRCPGFPYFGLWTQSDAAPFVCLEPWYGRLDDNDFSGELPEKTGILKLEAGEEFAARYEIIR